MSSQIITSSLLEEEPDLIDLIDKFISRLPGMRDDILQSHQQKDWEKFLKLIHQLKGVGGGYGYAMITEICAEIEESCNDEDFEKVGAQIDEFKNMSEQVLAGSDENHKIAMANS